MISRRNYFSIIMMMVLLFGIVMFSVIINKRSSSYDINEFVVEEEELPSGRERWAATEGDELVVFFGGQDSLESVVTQWCLYTKRALLVFDKMEDYHAEDYRRPCIFLLDAKELIAGENFYKELLRLVNLDVPMVFCTIPDASYVAGSSLLREILGIEEVVARETDVLGIKLFDGFLLGGTVEYMAETKKDKKLQDFELTVPWYINGSKTKVYMVGIKDEDEVKEEDRPCLIWRNSFEGNTIFAVCMDYMSTLAGLGILDSFMYELKQYEIYPVVNAQNVLVYNFPNLSEENKAELMRLYSRNPQMYFQGIMWPSISAMAKTAEVKLTCMLNTQYDYADSKELKKEEVAFYLQQIKEINSEAGMSLTYTNAELEEVLKVDHEFFKSLNSNYKYQTIFTGEKDINSIKMYLGNEGLLEDIVSVGATYKSGEALISYLTDEVTLQRTTADAKVHTYNEDFIVRGIQTALLYSNVLIDLHDAVWPENTEDEWQIFYDDIASNIKTYWSGEEGHEQTVMSESDYRIRTMLNLDYSHERSENKVVLNVENAKYGACFMLRTHDERIVSMTGGEFEELEKNVYLISVKEPVVEIELRQAALKEQKER